MLGLEYRIKDLEPDGKDIDMSLPRDFLSDALSGPDGPMEGLGDSDAAIACSTLRLTAHLSKVKSTVLCDGWLRGRLALACQRCLGSAAVPVAIRVHSVYVPTSDAITDRSEGSDEDADEEDLDFAHHDGDVVDLWPLLREQIILAIPITVLCQESCRGLCPSCGTDRNLAACGCQPAAPLSPFAALKELKLPS